MIYFIKESQLATCLCRKTKLLVDIIGLYKYLKFIIVITKNISYENFSKLISGEHTVKLFRSQGTLTLFNSFTKYDNTT